MATGRYGGRASDRPMATNDGGPGSGPQAGGFSYQHPPGSTSVKGPPPRQIRRTRPAYQGPPQKR